MYNSVPIKVNLAGSREDHETTRWTVVLPNGDELNFSYETNDEPGSVWDQGPRLVIHAHDN